jgi:hypothetical protein
MWLKARRGGRSSRLCEGRRQLYASSPHREVRYIVWQLADPGEPEGERDKIGWYYELGLAISHARRTGSGTCVDAAAGLYYPRGPGQPSRWHVEWTNHDVYEGKAQETVS